MATSKKYWKGIDELENTIDFEINSKLEFQNQNPSTLDMMLGGDQANEEDESKKASTVGRRDFLKFVGFSVAAAAVVSCEAPVTKAVPYVIKPEDVMPGMPTFYASTYYDGVNYASIIVKTREGRPIFIKGNKDFGFTKGATNPQIIASVLSLYDSTKLRNPVAKGAEKEDWSEIDEAITAGLTSIKARNGKIVFVSNTIISPSLQTAINRLKETYASDETFTHIQYDAVSYAAIRQANEISFGKNVVPDYDFSKAKTVVSVGADFLNSWLLHTEYTNGFYQTRNPENDWMSQHFQFESNMSVTGSNADYRAMIKPSEQAKVLSYILAKLGTKTSIPSDLSEDVKAIADRAVNALKSSKGESIVVAGSNDLSVQILANKINSVLNNYSGTININNPVFLFQSNDKLMQDFANDMIKGTNRPDAIFFYDVNPVYSLPNGEEFGKSISKVGLTVSFSTYNDETASKCQYITPKLHALEEWHDYQPKANHFALAQPTIRPLFNAASVIESLLVWSDAKTYERGGKDSKVAYNFIKDNFTQTQAKDFDMTVHNSCIDSPKEVASATFNDAALGQLKYTKPSAGSFEIELYQNASIGTGIQGGNPWLQEMPDPITKVTWDNFITMNPVQMKELDYVTKYDEKHGLNLATVKVNGVEIELPVVPSPGQAMNTVGIALGYGRGAKGTNAGAAAYVTKPYGGFETDEEGNRIPVGQNVFPLVSSTNGLYNYYASSEVTKSDKPLYLVASTQLHFTVMGRHSIVRETTFDIFKDDKRTKQAYNPDHEIETHDGAKHVSEFDLWAAHPIENVGHRWGMSVDLNKCFGCGACLIACQAENNIPVVGKDEVRRGREMGWIRIDRYYSSDEEVTTGIKRDDLAFDRKKAEIASNNPKVVHMPMMCQHCNHAPCETVCPVAATTHSDEGLNQMAYNRCIGTRYCANNCPYKVRRFNWFNYPSYKKFTQINPSQDDLGRMVLNPDVVVRTRGVMEKCTFCVQRIQAGKLEAKAQGRPVDDGEIMPACAEACPSNAISFGDWNDKKSQIRRDAEDDRAYQALEELGTKPNVWYKVKVRNNENKELETVQTNEFSKFHKG